VLHQTSLILRIVRIAVLTGLAMVVGVSPAGAAAGPSTATAPQCTRNGQPVPCDSLTGGGSPLCTVDGRTVSCDGFAPSGGGGSPRAITPPRSGSPTTVGGPTTTAPSTTTPPGQPAPPETTPPRPAASGKASPGSGSGSGRNPAAIVIAAGLVLVAGSAVGLVLRREYLLER
jgi:hypothetical protein